MARLVEPLVASGSLARLAQPVLDAGGFLLRPWQASDAAAVTTAYSEPSIQHWHARSMTLDEARAWIDSWPDRWSRETGCGWALATEAQVLGQLSLRRLDLAGGLAEVSYWVLPAARGHGVAARALGALSAWVFDEVRLHRIELNHSVRNPASCRVAARARFALEGTKRSEAWHDDGWHDMHLHARLSGDPR